MTVRQHKVGGDHKSGARADLHTLPGVAGVVPLGSLLALLVHIKGEWCQQPKSLGLRWVEPQIVDSLPVDVVEPPGRLVIDTEARCNPQHIPKILDNELVWKILESLDVMPQGRLGLLEENLGICQGTEDVPVVWFPPGRLSEVVGRQKLVVEHQGIDEPDHVIGLAACGVEFTCLIQFLLG